MNRIKELREKRKISLREMSKETNIPNNTLSQYENGHREPKLERWQKLADYFGVPVPYLQGTQAIKVPTLYVLTESDYEDRVIRGIFTSLEGAFVGASELINKLGESQIYILNILECDSIEKVNLSKDMYDCVRNEWTYHYSKEYEKGTWKRYILNGERV